MSNKKSKRDWSTYQGIKPLPDDRGYIPYELFDKVFPHIDSLAELKIVLYIVRRTTPFKKTEDWIAKCQFEEGMMDRETGEKDNPGAGLSRPSIDKGIKLAIQHGIIKERIECGRCGEELNRENEERNKRDGETGEIKTVIHHRVPKVCPNCESSTQTRMKYYYQLTYSSDYDADENEWDD